MIATDKTNHLTSEQMDLLLYIGPAEIDQESAGHLRGCSACSKELQELRLSLGAFRATTTALAEKAAMTRPRTNLLPARPVWGWTSFRATPAYFALAAGLTVAAVLVPFVRHSQSVAEPAQPLAQSTRNVADDDALLRDIDQQLDASVPSAMEPLADPAMNSTRKLDATIKDTNKD
ncbi:hypothetical protein [Granulicella sibirica]|uniref:Zinc-finger domain-containing protein n=1 Tax=Granulicella sibirica TaxID=2479048 RepID=A0A4Q0T6B2_9BACT|nr:hypothetical protein [Granulicella sibirica]RXH57539.1 hypothetical protein GRAN_0849 [Granulicella sibirica]